MQDVTERRRAEAELAQYAEDLRESRQELADVIAATGAVTYSREFLRHYSLSTQSVHDYAAWRRLVHLEDIERAEADRDEASARGEPFTSEFRIITP